MRMQDALHIAEHFASRLERPVRPAVAVAGFGKAFALAAAAAEPLPAPHVSIGAAVGHGPLGWRVAVRAWTARDLALARPTLEALERESHRELQIMLTGPVHAQVSPAQLQRRHRPLRPGYSVGHYNITAGTLGCFVRDSIGDLCILSNRHVLADTNEAYQDDPILQMGALDGGTVEHHAVAGLRALIALETRRNVVDAAIAAVYDDLTPVEPTLPGIGRIARGKPRLPNGDVQKVGRTTGHTWGRVTAIGTMSVPVDYGPEEGVYRFDRVIEVQAPHGEPPFSDAGDSGSLVVDADRHPIGLLFGGNRRVTYLNPIGDVLEALDLRLVS